MSDISRITLPSGTTYDIKDATAREQIAAIVGGDIIRFVGVSSTEITDGGTETPTIGGEQHTPTVGDLVFYGAKEFIYTGDAWSELGDLSNLGDLALYDTIDIITNDPYPNYTPTGTVTGNNNNIVVNITGTIDGSIIGSGNMITIDDSFTPQGSISSTNTDPSVLLTITSNPSGNYTPSGSISAPVISVNTAGATTTIHNPTAQTVTTSVTAAAPGATAPNNAITYYSVNNETLSLYQLGYNTGNSIVTDNVIVKTSDATYDASTPTFFGDTVGITGEVAATDIANAVEFTGTQATISVSANDIAAELSFSDSSNLSASVAAVDVATELEFSGDGVLIAPGTLP